LQDGMQSYIVGNGHIPRSHLTCWHPIIAVTFHHVLKLRNVAP
jgi:hypothetical protein